MVNDKINAAGLMPVKITHIKGAATYCGLRFNDGALSRFS